MPLPFAISHFDDAIVVQALDYVEASDVEGAAEDYADVGWGDDEDTAWFGSSLVKRVKKIAKGVGKGLGKITNNPIWNIGQTGAAFIPGIGSAVSAGMATAAAVGRGKSLKNIGLAAARAAIPPGPARIAADIALGAIEHHNLGALALRQVRANLPVPESAKGAFDAMVMIASKAAPETKARLASKLSAPARTIFSKAIAAHANPPKFRTVYGHAIPGRTRTMKFPFRMAPPNPIRPFPQLTGPQNKVAAVLMNSPEFRSAPAAKLARAASVDTRDARAAIAAFLRRFHATREFTETDVGEMETFDQAARRHNVIAENLGEWPTNDVGEIHVFKVPPLPVSRAMLKTVYKRGDANIRRALLAHELLAHVARNTGELVGNKWVVRGNGDWPWKVAQTVVGEGNRWKEILPLNPNLHVQANGNIPQWRPGLEVLLPPGWVPSAVPPTLPVPTPGVPAPVSASIEGGPPFTSAYPLGYPSSIYSVKKGDTGEKIAELITGEKSRWIELVRANPKLASEKYGLAIYVGQKIRLPAKWVAAQATPPVVVISQPPSTLPKTETPPSPPIGIPPVGGGGDFGKPPPLPPFIEPPIEAIPPAKLPPIETEPPIVTGSAEQIATIQIMLGAFFRDHPDATFSIPDAPYGATPEDYAGVWTDRTTAAFLGFERWWNAQKKQPVLEADGLPDGDAVAALMTQTQADGGAVDIRSPIALKIRGVTQRAAPTLRTKKGGDIVPLALILAALGAG